VTTESPHAAASEGARAARARSEAARRKVIVTRSYVRIARAATLPISYGERGGPTSRSSTTGIVRDVASW
jgi:hypothetical protein